ncbi:proton-conducting transporter membrane subunit [Gordonia sp. AC31]|uniref:proton-conducting transporter transmembrane domain-containing protein n=1 Tax=Gordonia sp. AC31 TaxID=2962571 RepID=UPI0028817854|nr:proton-conducting transporter membrane subunit [Gordonia sp. AC31]MDT0224027.1 proton-conducting transporter membrane subunit [Gordonia sp. AC31]
MPVEVLGQIALVSAIGLPLTVAVTRPLLSPAVRRGMWWSAAAAALVTTVVVLLDGPVSVLVGGNAISQPVVGVIGDHLTVWLLLLISGVGAVVHSYAGRYLFSDPHAGRFEVAMAVTVSAMAVVATSATVIGLIVGWVVAGLGFAAIAGYRQDLPGGPRLVASVRTATLVGDTALVLAGVAILAVVGNLSLHPDALRTAVDDLGAWHGVLAMLIAVAVLARCAQGRFRTWLRLTVAAPTPVCALLHAGVVNGGGIAMVRLGPLAAWTPALIVIAVVATATATWSGLAMVRHPDVKGQLAASTSAQMGFMLVQCTVGAYPAAILHLLGHSLYKAALFLASGSRVPPLATPHLPRATHTPGRVAAATVATLAALIAASPSLLTGHISVVTVYAAVTSAAIAAGWWLRRSPTSARRWLWPAGLTLVAAAYGTVVHALGGIIAISAPATATGLSAWWLLAVAASTLALTMITSRSPLSGRLHTALINAARPPAGPRRTAQACPPGPQPQPEPTTTADLAVPR